jgi:hypothetical protein
MPDEGSPGLAKKALSGFRVRINAEIIILLVISTP